MATRLQLWPHQAFKPGLLQMVFAAGLLAAGAPALAQSLVQTTEQAQLHDATWQSQRAALDAAISRGEQARAGLLPSVGLQGNANWSHSRVEANLPPSVTSSASAQQQSLNLSAAQPLYNRGNRISFDQGQKQVEIAWVQLDASRQDLLLRTAKAYFELLAAQDSLRVYQAQKRAVAEQLAFALRNFEIGAATVTDSREAQAKYDLVNAQAIAAANELRVKRLALEQLSGAPVPAPWTLRQPVQLPPLVPADLSIWLEQAESQHPLVRQALIAKEVAELETRKAEAGHLPTVDLQATYGLQRNPDGTTTLPGVHSRSQVGTIGVVLNVPLFAGFAVQNRVKETISLEEKARADLQEAQRNIAQATRTAFYGVESGYAQVQALEAAVTSSQSALEANQIGYEVGVRINIDVLNAQSQWYQAQKDLAQARYNHLLGQLQLRQAAGSLSLQDVQAINALLTPAGPP